MKFNAKGIIAAAAGSALVGWAIHSFFKKDEVVEADYVDAEETAFDEDEEDVEDEDVD